MNTSINTAVWTLGVAFATLMLVLLPITAVHAADDGFDIIDTFYGSGSDGSGSGFDTIDTYYESGYDSYDYVPDYGSGFGGGGYNYGGGGFTGGSTLGGGGNRQSQNQSQAQSQSSYNSNVNNNIITIGGQISQQTQYCPQGMTGSYPNCSWPQQYCPSGYTGTYPNCVPPVQQYCPSGYSGIYPNCVAPVQYCPSGYSGIYPNCVPPVVQYCPSGYSGIYPNCVAPRIAYGKVTPYVTLAAVPYTGLELGPLGTALYWGFLVLWCLFAAYLIVVKKVHNKIAAWFTGSASQNTFSQKVLGSPSLSAQPDHFAQKYSAPKSQSAGIDPFIQAQINRAK